MRRESCSSSWRIRLDGISLIEQSLVIELAKQPPQGLDILVVVCNIRMVEIHEISHFLGELAPFSRKHHHVLTAFAVVVFNRDILARLMVVDVGLGNAKLLLHSQFHRQSMSIPSSLAVNLIPLHRLVSVECILDGSCKHMVNSWMPVSRGRSLKEYKLRTTFTFIYRLVEYVISVPLLKHIFVHLSQIQAIVFGEFLCHICYNRSIVIYSTNFQALSHIPVL